jgi:hypothetical protein
VQLHLLLFHLRVQRLQVRVRRVPRRLRRHQVLLRNHSRVIQFLRPLELVLRVLQVRQLRLPRRFLAFHRGLFFQRVNQEKPCARGHLVSRLHEDSRHHPFHLRADGR